MKIKVTHLGEDYATVELNGEEFQTSLGFGDALFEAQKEYDIVNYYAQHDMPAIGHRYEKDGETYEVVDNSVQNVSTAKRVK